MMKKTLIVTVLLFCVLILTSCDYPEKSFQALDRESIPKEVTRDFQLERGVYSPFVWTSDSDAIVISGNDAIVNQKEENIVVTITATINKKSESFVIIVLKIGSPLSKREKAMDIAVYLNETYKEIDGDLLELPNEMNGIYIKYHLDLFQSSYGYKSDEHKTYLSSSFRSSGAKISIAISFYDDVEMNPSSRVYDAYLDLIAHPIKNDDPFLLAFLEINTKNYSFTNHLRYQVGITQLKVGDVIEFGNSEAFDVKLHLNRDEYFLKLDENKYEIIKRFRDNISELAFLTITIDGVSKTVFVHMYM
ncbi:hypothetical protein JN09_001515 [Acholeplasma morum]|nr:hypothetical protein [Paracholeplasma morum]